MNKIEQDDIILKTITQKLNNKRGAKMAQLSMNEFLRRKKELRNKMESEKIGVIKDNYNIDRGTRYMEGLFNKEPLGPEDIESWFKVDKKKWRLSSYWNKQQSNGLYLISAQISQNKESAHPIQHLQSYLNTVKLSYKPSTPIKLNHSYSDKTCAVLSLQDIHIGKLSTDKKNTIVSDVKECVENLVRRAYQSHYIDQIIWVLGGDLINMDTYNGTTTNGTIVENNTDAYNAFKIAFDLQFWCINFLKEYCNNLIVSYIGGNHSRLSEAHIAYALSKIIISPDIVWDIEYNERKTYKYGINMLGFEHGDFNTNRSFFAFASEFPEIWGLTRNRVVFTGHLHKKKKTEYITEDEINGFQLKILPSLSRVDNYHYSNKWTNNGRSAIIELYSQEEGFVAQLNKTMYT